MRRLLAGLIIAAAAALGSFATPADAASCGRDALRKPAQGGYSPSGIYTKSVTERRAPRAVLCLINNERAAAGVPPLRSHALLGALANRHASDLVRNGITDPGDPHKGSDGSTPATRLLPYTANFGRSYFRIAETVTEGPNGSPLAAVRWWMGSPLHRAILLDPALEDVGIAMFAKRPGGGSGGTYVADFGTARN
jgi:uncharacterized protein YkwD